MPEAVAEEEIGLT